MINPKAVIFDLDDTLSLLSTYPGAFLTSLRARRLALLYQLFWSPTVLLMRIMRQVRHGPETNIPDIFSVYWESAKIIQTRLPRHISVMATEYIYSYLELFLLSRN